MGSVLRRLVAKLGCRAVRGVASSILQPQQLGFGVPLGCEAAIHATRSFSFERENSDNIIVKVDLQNAFNTVERDVMLCKVNELVPTLYSFLHQCYSGVSNLFFGQNLVVSGGRATG